MAMAIYIKYLWCNVCTFCLFKKTNLFFSSDLHVVGFGIEVNVKVIKKTYVKNLD